MAGEPTRNRSPGLRLCGIDSGFVRAALTLDPAHLARVEEFLLGDAPIPAQVTVVGPHSPHSPHSPHRPHDPHSPHGLPGPPLGQADTAVGASGGRVVSNGGARGPGATTTPPTACETETDYRCGEVVLTRIDPAVPPAAHAQSHARSPATAAPTPRPREVSVRGAVRLFHYEADAHGGPAVEEVGQLVCLYAVSDWVAEPESALAAVLEPFAATVMRCIVCAEPEHARALVLLWFTSHAAGQEFVTAMNGQPFDRERASEQCHAMVLSGLTLGTTTASVVDDLANCFEIPRCPVCLERLDDTLGATLLQPLARGAGALAPCWRRIWEKCTTCALLRGHERVRERDESGTVACREDAAQCDHCGEHTRLWACMVCAFVGCSRPQYGADDGAAIANAARSRNGHMLEHWIHTGRRHKLAVDLTSQWVWDYQGDGFVHHSEQVEDSPSKAETAAAAAAAATRLAHEELTESASSQRLRFAAVDFGDATHVGEGDDPKAAFRVASSGTHPGPHAAATYPEDCKAERITTEYVGLLSSQLESQRLFFAETATKTKQLARANITALQAELRVTLAENAALDAELAGGAATVDCAVQAQSASTAGLSRAFDDLREERSRCQKLMADQAAWQARLAQARTAVETTVQARREHAAQLREENADLAAALAMRKQISSAPPEMQRELKEGTMVRGDPAPPPIEPPRRDRRRRSKGKGR